MKTKKWYITSVYPKKEGTGSDFYLDNLYFFNSFNFKTVNTLKYGHIWMFLWELLLLIRIPKGTTIITTWVGFPRQLLVANGFSNKIRFRLFTYIKNYKRWKYYIIPIDLPLQQFSFRLDSKTIEKQTILERKIFNCADGFICAGVDMENYFKRDYPLKEFYMFDMYDQNLPNYYLKERHLGEKKKIAIVGNLVRMTDEILSLPTNDAIRYVFFGPNGEKVIKSNRQDFTYLGNLMGMEFAKRLAECDFGLIIYSRSFETYAARAIAGKVSTYLYALLPVICPLTYSSMSELVTRLKIGLVINDLSQLNEIPELPLDKYDNWVENCTLERQKILVGGHYKEVLQKMGFFEK